MNIQRLMNMFINLVMRKVMNRGIDAGINYATRGRKDDDEAIPADPERAESAKAMAKKARQGAKLARRLGRM